jgi:hypothetical protein
MVEVAEPILVEVAVVGLVAHHLVEPAAAAFLF